MKTHPETTLPLNTEVEVVAFRRGIAVDQKIMTYEAALKLKKSKGFVYRIFQRGFAQFKNVKN